MRRRSIVRPVRGWVAGVVPSCLADVREVFEVEEELAVLVHSFLAHDAEDHVWLWVVPVGVVFESLSSGVVALDPEACFAFLLPDADEPEAVSWGERDVCSRAVRFLFS